MKQFLIVALVIILCGCNAFSKRVKEVPDTPDVAEVPDEVWKRVQQRFEEQRKASAPKKDEQPAAGQEKDRPQVPDPGRALDAATKRK